MFVFNFLDAVERRRNKERLAPFQAERLDYRIQDQEAFCRATDEALNQLITRQGIIFYRHVGPMSVETLQSKLAELGL